MLPTLALSVALALLGAPHFTAHGAEGGKCSAIGELTLGMHVAEASRLLGGASFEQDTTINAAKTVVAAYTTPRSEGSMEGEATVVAVKGRVRHVYFRRASRDRLAIEDCGTASWSKAPTGNPGNVTECRVIRPQVELLVNRSGPSVWLGLIDTRFAPHVASASVTKLVSRRACAEPR